ncbi:MAG: PAS domain S-box protein [Bacteroidales bacterium]|nr:PAS domain S-box protein [Bacteroidales bacterium]
MNKILIIDDQKSILAKVKDVLEKSIPECIVLTAQSGAEGIKIAKIEQPDTILLDVVMPEMNGYEVCKKLKENKQTKSILIILVSALKKDIDSRIKGLNSGADVFLSKPIDSAELIAQVSSMLRIRKSEKDIKESEEIYKSILENMIDGYYKSDKYGNAILISPSVEKLLGFNKTEILGKKISDYYANPKDREHFLKEINKNGNIENYSTEFIKKNGDKIFIESNSRIYYDNNGDFGGIEGTFRDITKRRQIEEEIKKLSIAVEQSANTIVITDIEGDIEYVNPKFTELTGYTADEALGQNPRILNAGTLPKEHYVKMWKIISSGKIWKGEFHNKKKNGKLFWENVTITPIKNDNGIIINYLAIKENITAEKQATEALKQHAKQLQERNEELDAFSHTVAHDLKNPLTTILGFAELLNEDYNNAPKSEIFDYSDAIIKGSKKMEQIINSLLLFASVRKTDTPIKELDMGSIINETIDHLSSIIKKSNAKIILPEKWPIVMGYAPWIEEVWTNYLTNAIKYGGVPPQIEVGTDTENLENVPKGMLCFWVRDNGPGISAANQKKLFKKFERLDQVKTEGHGLGLSIVRRIIEKLNGKAWVKSKIGKGSCFYFTLPFTSKPLPKSSNAEINSSILEAMLRNIKSETHEATQACKENLKTEALNLKILIAEDEEYAKIHLSIILKQLSKEILHTKNGEKAVEICKSNPDIDLVLMDIQMPIMDGYEAIRKIREFNKDVIIIAQTAYALQGDREKAIRIGCNDYISKPINKNKLIEIIWKYFGNV